ncbi:MAG: hypothetical protein MJ065_03125 [Oscillospiraceae bacterium]|nr:hypothetical protein [Oscillospiraceae bacterium]
MRHGGEPSQIIVALLLFYPVSLSGKGESADSPEISCFTLSNHEKNALIGHLSTLRGQIKKSNKIENNGNTKFLPLQQRLLHKNARKMPAIVVQILS